MPHGGRCRARLLGFLIAVMAAGLTSLGVPAAAADAPRVELHHLLVGPGPEGILKVQERIVLNNPGAPLPAGTVKFYLPEGAQNLVSSPEVAALLEAKAGALVVKGKVPSGQSSYGFGYEVTSGGAPHFILRHKLDYPTDQMYILAPPQGVQVQSDRVQDAGLNNFGGQDFRLFMVGQLPAAQEVVLTISLGAGASGSGEASGSGGGSGGGAYNGVTRKAPVSFHNPGHIRLWYQSPFKGIDAHLFLAIVIGAPLIVMANYLVQRRKRKAAAARAQRDPEEELFQRLRVREKVLLEKMVQLESQRERQEVDEETYQRLREAVKQKLVQVKVQLRQLAG